MVLFGNGRADATELFVLIRTQGPKPGGDQAFKAADFRTFSAPSEPTTYNEFLSSMFCPSSEPESLCLHRFVFMDRSVCRLVLIYEELYSELWLLYKK